MKHIPVFAEKVYADHKTCLFQDPPAVVLHQVAVVNSP